MSSKYDSSNEHPIDSNAFNLGFITDVHYDQGRGRPHADLMLHHLKDVLAFDSQLDAIVFGGDNIDGFQLNKQRNVAHLKQFIKLATAPGQSDRFLLNGNHDDGSLRTKDFNWHLPKSEIITRKEFQQLFGTSLCTFGEVRDNGSLYFYKDYPDKHLRIVGVDTSDINERTNESNELLHYRQWDIAVQERQLQWLSTHALQNLPEDFQVLFLSHAPLDPNPVQFPDHTEVHINHNLLIDVINAFIQGTELSIHSNIPDYKVDIHADFRQQGPRIVAGWINGHTHQNAIQKQGKLWVIHCLNSVYNKPEELGTPQENSFAIISLSPPQHKLTVRTLGRGQEIRTITY